MNNNVQLWLSALRSGQYQQTQNFLKNYYGEPRYCCLGVACDLYCKNVKNIVDEDGLYDGNDSILPDEVKDWLGLNSHSGSYGEALSQTLTWLNDEDRYTFNQIADFIEANKEKLFVQRED